MRLPICLSILLITMLPQLSSASSRVALVIGNGQYKTAPLKNPVNDARDMSSLLRTLDFDVISVENGSKRKMVSALVDFSEKLKRSEIGLFYYAGHGMQVRNRNYLIPVGVKVFAEDEVEFEAVDAGRVISKMRSARNKLNIVILDACRNNPFERSFRSATQGLARMDAPKGTLIAYATSPGSVAMDGKDRNGVFTKHLLSAMRKPNLDIQNIFNEAGMAVMDETNDAQIPWTSNTPIPRFFLAGGNPDDMVSDAGSGYGKQEAETGRLKVSSEPSGAMVLIDGRKAGNTPVQLGNMEPGTVTVSVNKSGYNADERRATIKPGRRTVVNFDMEEEQKAGWLTVKTTPANAKVRILNIGPRYQKDMELEAGRYHVEVSSPGYVTQKRWVEMAVGDDITVDVSLVKERIASKPAATVATGSSQSMSRSYTDSVTGMEFVYVPGGCFQMGDTFGGGEKSEQPVHEVCVDDFYMGKYEVTQGEYWRIAGSNPSKFKKGDNYPVERVRRSDAQAFIHKLNGHTGKTFRLPTEAEWEYAARSGGKREKYAGGRSLNAVAWYMTNSGKTTHRVGGKRPNGLGLHDMTGNVWEWCQDWYDQNYYSSSPRNNPEGPSSGSGRVVRGGAWDFMAAGMGVTFRGWRRPEHRSFHLGFRLVLPVQR